MQTTDKSGVSLFVQAAVKAGMKHVVCSPGSRNAPLIIALDNQPAINTYIIHDERSAAFYALGMALQLKSPVGLVCTSGSAMLNYYPAVAEAFYQCIPLVVMSADRPEEWVNHGDGQTIVQAGVYTNHIRSESVVPEKVTSDKDKKELIDDIQTAFQSGNGDWKGPIHFNFPLSEPLYNAIESTLELIPDIEEPIRNEFAIDPSFLDAWNMSEKRMILVGQMDKNSIVNDTLSVLAQDASTVVMVENTSNVQNQRFIHCIDRTLSGISENESEYFIPDVLLTLGGAVISKRIKKFLREAPEMNHYKVGFEFPEMDTYRKLAATFEVDPGEFLRKFVKSDRVQNRSNFGGLWKQKDLEYEALTRSYIETAPYSDLTVFDVILDCIPENTVLHMGNSSVVRYCQLFDPIRSITYRSNRGTSGIDGSASTACGAALADPDHLHVLIIGDVSFFYDSNALWSNNLPENLRIFLINNDGGGIFRIIDGPKDIEQGEQYFEAPHNHSAEYICRAFNVEYRSARSLKSIEDQMVDFFADARKTELMEIFTPRTKNNDVLKTYFELKRPS